MYDLCKCLNNEGSIKKFNYMHGLWCCNTEPCEMDPQGSVTCKGQAIPLTEKCLSGMNGTNVCNSNPLDSERNTPTLFGQRSHLDICGDR